MIEVQFHSDWPSVLPGTLWHAWHSVIKEDSSRPGRSIITERMESAGSCILAYSLASKGVRMTPGLAASVIRGQCPGDSAPAALHLAAGWHAAAWQPHESGTDAFRWLLSSLLLIILCIMHLCRCMSPRGDVPRKFWGRDVQVLRLVTSNACG